MPRIIPITDLRDTNKISELAHAKKEPIFVTKNGYGELVIMSIETFDSMLADRELDMAIAEAEAEYISDNQLINARKALSNLKRKHFGK